MDAMVKAVLGFISHKKGSPKPVTKNTKSPSNNQERRSRSLSEKELMAAIAPAKQNKTEESSFSTQEITNPQSEILGHDDNHMTIQRVGSASELCKERSTKLTQLKQQREARTKRKTVQLMLNQQKQEQEGRRTKATNDLRMLLLTKTTPAPTTEIASLWQNNKLANINSVDENGNTLLMQLIQEIATYKNNDLLCKNPELLCLVDSLKNFLSITRCGIKWEHKNNDDKTVFSFITGNNSNNRILNYVTHYLNSKQPGKDTLSKYEQQQMGQNIFENFETIE